MPMPPPMSENVQKNIGNNSTSENENNTTQDVNRKDIGEYGSSRAHVKLNFLLKFFHTLL